MLYQSTRGNNEKVTAAEAIKTGMVPSGGLFVPEKIPSLKVEEIINLSYAETAEKVFALFLSDFQPEEIKEMTSKVYSSEIFGTNEIAPLKEINEKLSILELWHGPTAAFKDMALQMLPYLMKKSLEKLGYDKELLILAATSGDTGKAALEGFKDIKGIKIICLYPHERVSKIQELQMTTTEGDNTFVVAVKGNFDDCQSKVKNIFSDEEFKKELLTMNTELSSANSINWGRLLPQIVYYYRSYANLVEKKQINLGEKINIVVPTGNFGNILAAWYAGRMGLPLNKLICASNINNVLTDFINTGKYDTHREFVETNSPSMDILVSSNLERFIFEITNRDDKFINGIMMSLKETGSFQLGSRCLEKIQNELYGDYGTEKETIDTIRDFYEENKYLLDTHTAVGVKVYEKYLMNSKDNKTYTIIDATANPYKFNKSVYEALKGKDALIGKEEFEILDELSEYTQMPVHPGLKDLDKKEVKHQKIAEINELEDIIRDIIKK